MLSIYFLFWGLVIASQTGLASSMRIEIKPNKYDDVVPISFNISCIAEKPTNCVKKILAIQVSKDGGRPLATLQQNSHILFNRLLRANIEAEGVIDSKESAPKFTISFSDVMNSDSGMYSCTSIYLDEWGNLQQDMAVTNFTVENHDVHDVVRHLLGKMYSLDTVLEAQRNQLAAQESLLERQDKELKAQEALLRSQQSQLDAQEALVESQRTQLAAHNLELETLANRTKASDEEVLQKIDTLTQMDENQNQGIETLLDRVSSISVGIVDACRNETQAIRAQFDNDHYTCAFSAGYQTRDTMTAGEVLVFSVPILDISDDYDETTGVFTAPVKGLYSFHLSIREDGGNAHIHLMAEDDIIASVYAYADDGHNDQTSVTAVAILNPGNVVRPIVQKTSSSSTLEDDVRHTFFTGYLIKRITSSD